MSGPRHLRPAAGAAMALLILGCVAPGGGDTVDVYGAYGYTGPWIYAPFEAVGAYVARPPYAPAAGDHRAEPGHPSAPSPGPGRKPPSIPNRSRPSGGGFHGGGSRGGGGGRSGGGGSDRGGGGRR